MSAEHLTLLKPLPRPNALRLAVDAFLLSREAMRCTPKTLEAYSYALGGFLRFLEAQGATDPQKITPTHVRAFLVALQRQGLKDTTQHLHARCLKTWLRWLVEEGELPESPMRRVAMPKLEKRIPPPFAPEDVHRLLDGCNRKTPKGLRDFSLLLALLDSGLRAAELCALRVGDVNPRTGLVAVRLGKGGKQRQTRLGSKARAALLRYLGTRGEVEPEAPLWVAYRFLPGQDPLEGEPDGPLSVHGLQTMLHRLGRQVGVLPCGPHRFRRTFALWCLRDGMDLHSLRLLMGHSSLAVLQRYLALAGEDVERAHIAHSPADRLL